jgi:nicotinamide riboside transporter PnuC
MNRTQESAMLLALAGVGAFGFWLWRRSKKKERQEQEAFWRKLEDVMARARDHNEI